MTKVGAGCFALAVLQVTFVAGCSDDPAPQTSGDAGGTANTAGDAGSKAQGGASSGAASGAGTNASGGAVGGAGGGSVGGSGNATGGKSSCGPMQVGYKSSAACTDSDLPNFPVGYTLNVPMTAGQTYAIGYGVNGQTNPKIEIWGTAEQCGAKLELLSSETRAEGRYCVELHPTAAHSSVFVSVSESASGAHLLLLCPDGTCQ